MAKTVVEAENNLDNDIKLVKETTVPISWTSLAASTMSELMDNLWELKEKANNFLHSVRMKRVSENENMEEIANKTINYYNSIRCKLNRLKTEIYNYNRRFPNNQIKNVEELIDSKIKKSVVTTLKEEILKACKN